MSDEDAKKIVSTADIIAALEAQIEILGALFVQISRVYDAIMFSLSDEDIETLNAKHATGGLFGAPPILNEDGYFTSEDSE